MSETNLIGGLIVANFATIITVLVFLGRTVWFTAKLDSRVENCEKDINGFGGRVKNVEEKNNGLDVRVSVLESRD